MMTLSLIWPVTAMGFLLSMTREAMTATSRIAEPCDINDGPAEQPEDDYLPYAAEGFVTPLTEL
jgi:ATP-binding cassette subfamily B protein